MKNIKKIIILLAVILLIFTLSSCGKKLASGKKQIVTTLYPQYEMVKAILGTNNEAANYYDVKLIIPPGADSHTYDPSILDLITLKRSELVIYTGDIMEKWVERLHIEEYTNLLDLSADDRIVLLEVEDGHSHNHEHDEHAPKVPSHGHHHEADPHFWIYPIYAKYMVEQIIAKLLEIAPSSWGSREKQIMIDNANQYINALELLDQDIKRVINAAGSHKVLYFASPFSFYYWAHYYEFEYVLTYATCSTEIEPSLSVMVDVIKSIKDHQAKYIYIKELLSTKAAQIIASHTGVEILLLHSCHNVSRNDLNDPNISFLNLMRQNVENLAVGLGVNINNIENYGIKE